jgi:type I restriction enzyme, S subunit
LSLQSFLERFDDLVDAPNSITRLRQFILQLVVEGKIVTQDPNEQVADILLSAINQEKNRQLKEKKSKQIEPLPLITQDDFLDIPIPTGWAWAWLGDLARFIDYRGKTPPKTESGVKLLTAKNVRMGFISEHPREFISEDSYIEVMTRGLPGFGDILFTTEAPLGNVAQLLTHERVALAQRVIDLQSFKPLFAEYLKICLMSPPLQEAIRARATGMTATGIKASKLKKLPVPVPPLAEQKRIVAKVNELMRLCDDLETRQHTKRESRARLNTAILAPLDKASSLTPKELEQATTRFADNFDTLYDSIDTVSKLRATILQLAVQGKLVRRPSENKSENGSRVSDYVMILNGYAFKSEWFVPYGIRLLRNTNIGHGSVQWEEVAYVAKDRANEFAKFALDDRDIVISLDRPLISTGLKVARISKKDLPSLLLQRVGKVKLKNNELDSDYFFMWLHSPAFVNAIDPGRSNGVPHISSKSIEAIPFAPPPLAEQKRIVAKVNQLMSLCNDLEAKLRQAEADSEKLTNAAIKHVLDSVRDTSKTAEEVFA